MNLEVEDLEKAGEREREMDCHLNNLYKNPRPSQEKGCFLAKCLKQGMSTTPYSALPMTSTQVAEMLSVIVNNSSPFQDHSEPNITLQIN